MTKKREAVLQILQESSGHMTAEEIFRIVRRRYPGIVLATVYNNLNALAESGVIRRIPVAGGSDFFDRTPTSHGHLICAGCGAVSDIETDALRSELERTLGVSISEVDLKARYLCPACRAAMEAAEK